MGNITPARLTVLLFLVPIVVLLIIGCSRGSTTLEPAPPTAQQLARAQPAPQPTPIFLPGALNGRVAGSYSVSIQREKAVDSAQKLVNTLDANQILRSAAYREHCTQSYRDYLESLEPNAVRVALWGGEPAGIRRLGYELHPERV